MNKSYEISVIRDLLEPRYVTNC